MQSGAGGLDVSAARGPIWGLRKSGHHPQDQAKESGVEVQDEGQFMTHGSLW